MVTPSIHYPQIFFLLHGVLSGHHFYAFQVLQSKELIDGIAYRVNFYPDPDPPYP